MGSDYSAKVLLIQSKQSLPVPYNHFEISAGFPDPGHIQIGYLNPVVFECSEGRWRGAVE